MKAIRRIKIERDLNELIKMTEEFCIRNGIRKASIAVSIDEKGILSNGYSVEDRAEVVDVERINEKIMRGARRYGSM